MDRPKCIVSCRYFKSTLDFVGSHFMYFCQESAWPGGYGAGFVIPSSSPARHFTSAGFGPGRPWFNSSTVLIIANWYASCQLGFLTCSLHNFVDICGIGPHQPMVANYQPIATYQINYYHHYYYQPTFLES